jgi:putative redox protein
MQETLDLNMLVNYILPSYQNLVSLHSKGKIMATVYTEYLGELRTKARHVQSGNELITDAPTDNHGRGEAFSPTDTLATSLGSCMLTIIGISARNYGFNIDGTKLNITKIMANDPRRVSEIILEFQFPANNYTEKEKDIIYAAAKGCPVARSLHPDLKQTIIMTY